MNRKRRGEDGGGQNGRDTSSDVPFRDADEDSGEAKLDSIDEFRVPARDDKGGSMPSTTYAPPLLWRHVEIIVHSKRFPYLNSQDFVRHAIVRHLRWASGLRQSIPKHLAPALEAMLEVVRDDEQRVQVEATLQRIKSRIDHYLSRGEMGDAVALIHRLKIRLEGVQPSFWLREFSRGFYARYGEYLDGRMVKRPDGEDASLNKES